MVSHFAGSYLPLDDKVAHTVERNQRERLERIFTECDSSKTQNVTADDIKSVLRFTDLVVDDAHKVLYCYVPKVGCTSWKVSITSTVHSERKIRDNLTVYYKGVHEIPPRDSAGCLASLNDLLFNLDICFRFNERKNSVFPPRPTKRDPLQCKIHFTSFRQIWCTIREDPLLPSVSHLSFQKCAENQESISTLYLISTCLK